MAVLNDGGVETCAPSAVQVRYAAGCRRRSTAISLLCADLAGILAVALIGHCGRRDASPDSEKARTKVPYATATKTTVTGKPLVTVFALGFS